MKKTKENYSDSGPRRMNLTPLIGKQFGRLTLLYRAPNDKRNKTCAVFQCSCGNQPTFVVSKVLVEGGNKSCGCIKLEKNSRGHRFGRLVALKTVGKVHNQSIWLCRCNCGKQTKVTSSNLINGRTRSCGCLYKESRGKTHLPNAKAEIAKIV